ncbi:TorF family putative porin [Echinimonas agarilytica]|uniref:TorF family putative porin n=1 Tax=Echinimonas agarilytica TaxID=1215918 RepID=A0AA41W433_9GAMM|nr:TorF family putative porin [Echinimonas agarilytica]MCM2678350.1 TorF family putative porin [Echinimonas agarilytica]
MKATKTLIASAILAASIAAPAAAVEGLSANAAVASDYVWRGLTQTDNGPAISGGIDYDAGNGIYVGTWASNVDFGDDDATYEWDFYAGYAGEIEGFSYDVGAIYYAYPDADEDTDFSELYVSGGYSFLTVGVATLIDSDAGGDFADDFYYNADATFEVAEGLELGLHVGYYDVDGADDEVIDYSASLSKDGFTFWVGSTDIDDDADETKDDEVRAVVSYSVDFDL